MISSIGATNVQSIGVMVVEEFINSDSNKFVRAACPDREFPEHVYTRWQDPTRRPQALAPEIPFTYCSTKLQGCVVHLFGFPAALSTTFSLEDLIFPIEMQGLGFIVIVNVHNLRQFEKRYLSSQVRSPENSALAWTTAHKLPFVVIAKVPDVSSGYPIEEWRSILEPNEDSMLEVETPVYSTEELRSILGLSVGVPICCCSSEFDGGLVQQVLSSLLKQFETP